MTSTLLPRLAHDKPGRPSDALGPGPVLNANYPFAEEEKAAEKKK